MNHPSANPPPALFRAHPLAALPGRWGKLLEVPAGRQGVALVDGAAPRLLPPGRHIVLGYWGRLRGLTGWAGYVPAGEFGARLAAEAIQSGDGVLLDASLLLLAQVVDPVRAFEQLAVPHGVLYHLPLDDLHGEAGKHELGALARPYAAADLIHGLPQVDLAAQAAGRLSAALAGLGLQVLAAEWLTFWRSAERAAIAEQLQGLEERLADVQVEAQLARIEDRLQLSEFLAGQAPELLDKFPLEALDPSPAKTGAPERQSFGARFRRWLKLENADPQRRWEQLTQLFKKEAPPPSDQPPQLQPRWWLPRSLATLGVLLLGLLITLLAFALGKRAPGLAVWEFILTGVWVAIAPIAIGNLWALLEKLLEHREARQQYDQQHHQQRGVVYLDDLVRNDRRHADRLVRGQVGGELEHAHQLLYELRGRVYRAGEVALAQRLRALEHKLAGYRERVGDPVFGVAPYVSDLHISPAALNSLLDEEEELLLQWQQVGDRAHALQQSFAAGRLDPAQLDEFETVMDGLYHRFAGRGRAIKRSPQDIKAAKSPQEA